MYKHKTTLKTGRDAITGKDSLETEENSSGSIATNTTIDCMNEALGNDMHDTTEVVNRMNDGINPVVNGMDNLNLGAPPRTEEINNRARAYNEYFMPRIDHTKELFRNRIVYSAADEGLPLNIYIRMLTEYVRANDIGSNDTIMQHVHTTLRGPARNWYWTVFVNQMDRSFSEFKDQLQGRFGEVLDDTQLLLKAAENKYTGGDLMEYVDKIVTILSRNSIGEQTQLKVILNGLPDDMRMNLVLLDITSLKRLFECLKKLFPNNCVVKVQPSPPKPFFKTGQEKSESWVKRRV